MTTAAWDLNEGILCIDGRVLLETEIDTDCANKRIVKGGKQFFIIGAIGDLDEIATAYCGNIHKVRKSIDSYALVIDGGKLIEIAAENGTAVWHPVAAKRGSLGSGSQWARVALDNGYTPKQAIQAAKRKDAGTGGRVRTYTIKQTARSK